MIAPSNWDEELAHLRKAIKVRLDEAARRIVIEEIENILGRVKIHMHTDLKDPQSYSWFIEASKEFK